jgi:hypothetical protein
MKTCCYCAGVLMNAVGLRAPDGWDWECPVCGHQELEIVKDGTFEDTLGWHCPCFNCANSNSDEMYGVPV